MENVTHVGPNGALSTKKKANSPWYRRVKITQRQKTNSLQIGAQEFAKWRALQMQRTPRRWVQRRTYIKTISMKACACKTCKTIPPKKYKSHGLNCSTKTVPPNCSTKTVPPKPARAEPAKLFHQNCSSKTCRALRSVVYENCSTKIVPPKLFHQNCPTKIVPPKLFHQNLHVQNLQSGSTKTAPPKLANLSEALLTEIVPPKLVHQNWSTKKNILWRFSRLCKHWQHISHWWLSTSSCSTGHLKVAQGEDSLHHQHLADGCRQGSGRRCRFALPGSQT